jgi:2-amino-4-hydroxy-6-hydroxymethyldihydropteridine diphosphokinase
MRRAHWIWTCFCTATVWLDEPDLTVPHARLHERAFVLLPLADLAPELDHPVLGDLAPHRAAVSAQALLALD